MKGDYTETQKQTEAAKHTMSHMAQLAADNSIAVRYNKQ